METTDLDEADMEAEWEPVVAKAVSDDTFVDEYAADDEEEDDEEEEDDALDDVFVEEPEPQPVAAAPIGDDWSKEPPGTSVPERAVTDGWTLPSLELLDNTPVGTPSTADNESCRYRVYTKASGK